MSLAVPIEILGSLAADTLKEGRSVELTVVGNSMFPLFVTKRDSVTLSPIGDIRRRMIIFYLRPTGKYVLHRVVRIKGDVLKVSGDNETRLEDVSPSQVWGYVTEFVRKGKRTSTRRLWYRVYAWLMCSFYRIKRPMVWIAYKLKVKK